MHGSFSALLQAKYLAMYFLLGFHLHLLHGLYTSAWWPSYIHIHIYIYTFPIRMQSIAGIFIQAIWLLTLRCLGFFCEPHSASSFYVGLHRLLATLLIATTSLTVSVFEEQVN